MGTLRKRMAAAAMALGFAAGARADLSLSDTLLAYQLYGKQLLSIDGDAVTSVGGGVGSDLLVNLTNNNVQINGNLTSGDRITTQSNIDVTGVLNARGNVSFFNDNTSVQGTVNVGGTLSITGANPSGNVFGARMWIRNSPISVAQGWATNTYNGTVRAGPVAAAGAPAGVTFGSNLALPSNNLRLPDTVVNPDLGKNCSTLPGVLLTMNMCGLGGAAGDSILPPGRYGAFQIASGNRVYLTSGTYHFRSLTLLSDGTRFLFLQPSGNTRVLIRDDFTIQAGNQLLAPTRYTDPSFTTGTVYIYVGGAVQLSDDNNFWATLVGRSTVTVETGLRLFGQILADRLTVENGFNGGPGLGRFIPLSARGPLKYSIIHFKHQD